MKGDVGAGGWSGSLLTESIFFSLFLVGNILIDSAIVHHSGDIS